MKNYVVKKRNISWQCICVEGLSWNIGQALIEMLAVFLSVHPAVRQLLQVDYLRAIASVLQGCNHMLY